MVQLCKEIIIYFLARFRDVFPVSILREAVLVLHKGFENYSYNHNLNGENYVIKLVGKSPTPVGMVWDVGAHHGEWSALAQKAFPNARIHAFEIAEKSFQRLKDSTNTLTHVTPHFFGVSNVTSEVELFFDEGSGGQSTMIETKYTEKFRRQRAQVRRGIEICEEFGIQSIDFLKIDVEGAEHLVLDGLEPLFADRRVAVVQFEYGKSNITTHFLLCDFHKFFTKYGYRVGKIFPNRVDFKDYSMEDENFIGPNFLAVRDDLDYFR